MEKILNWAIKRSLNGIFFYMKDSKRHNFLLSTYEFIVVAKSNRVAVFFMFNVIIITLVLGSFRPSREDLEWYEMENDTKKEASNDEDRCCDDSDCDEGYGYYGSDGYDEDEDDDGSDDDINSEEFFGLEIDTDLERRTEDFIAKVTRKWREELLYEKLTFMAAIDSQAQPSSSS
ncbi:uncharacterized protein LOC110767006 [Prunus avium]|uniref:Uncharacterized protein LOC110767006 n=1 Tax=Prunus avium TaxID=42229 RepID=A0A6P5TGC0_PRUAV|nr:uncharacterized protein LOC110767006 [Prunus avium]